MGARKKRVAQKMPQEEGVNAPIMAQVKANLTKVPEEVIEEPVSEEPEIETFDEEIVEALEPELPQFNWLKVPPGAVDMRSMELFTPGGESYKTKYDDFIKAGYKVKSLSVNENVIYYLFELCK